MLTTEAKCRINGIHIAEVKIEARLDGTANSMTATYATLEAVSDKADKNYRMAFTHGKCTAGHGIWSQETAEKLSDLLRSMEADLLPQHFKLEAGLEGIADGSKGSEPGEFEEADQV